MGQIRSDTSVLYLCRLRPKMFLRKYSPSIKCAELPNDGTFGKSNAGFAHGSQNITLLNYININFIVFFVSGNTEPSPNTICYQLANFTICEKWQMLLWG